jgi:uncharacterized protein (UPF0333 family)
MNDRLQFSWGHIVAFIALIAVSYTSFVGLTYLTDGDFKSAAIGMGIIDVTFLIFFIGAQQLKSSGVKMAKKIILERVLIFLSPVVFIVGMIPMSHFWTVTSQNDSIVKIFTQAINNSKNLFTDYETYSQNRISQYKKGLSDVLSTRTNNIANFRSIGFEEGNYSIQKDNMVTTLQLQLLSVNYDSLKVAANSWIDHANQGASTWNVFILGNTREIKSAVISWENQLQLASNKTLSNEKVVCNVSSFTSGAANRAVKGIEQLTQTFITFRAPNAKSYIFGCIIYLMLLFPYMLQDRHTKSIYTLFGKKQKNKYWDNMESSHHIHLNGNEKIEQQERIKILHH